MKIMVTDYAWEDLEIERKILSTINASLVTAHSGTEDELVELAAGVDGIFTNWKPVTRKIIANARKCKAIVRYGVGLDNIDVQYATEMGILVANVPGYCLEEVSDHALALLFALARKITLFDRAAKSGIYDLRVGPPFYRLRGKTLGLVGFGKIGSLVCRKAMGLGLEVIAFHRTARFNSAKDEAIETVSFPELLRRSDYISIHAPLTFETHHLFNLAALQQMKSTAFLINTARGDIVDSKALLQALDDGLIAGAGLDVLPEEPPDTHDPLLLHPKTIVTPHAAFNSVESLQELRSTAAAEMLDALLGNVPQFVVNPEVLHRHNLRTGSS